MRHFLTMLIAFHWMAVFAILAAVSTLESEHGMLGALRFLGAVPLSDAHSSGGGPAVAGFLSFTFAVASLLFLWTLLTALWGDGMFGGQAEEVARRAFGSGIGLFSLLLIGGAVLPVSGLFLTSAVAVTALLASYLATSAERWAACVFGAGQFRPSRRGSRHGRGGRAQRLAHPLFRPDERRDRRGTLMKYIVAIWATPLLLFWGWFFLSLNDMNFGYIMLTRQVHDLVFQLYGDFLGVDPASIPAMVAQACIFDTGLIAAIWAFRRRRELAAWARAGWARYRDRDPAISTGAADDGYGLGAKSEPSV